MFNKKLIFAVRCLAFSQMSLASSDNLGLAGNYLCSGYDMHDGGYQNLKASLTLDKKDSDFAHNFGAYNVSLKETDGTTFIGEAAASGNSLAIYFENTAASKPTDRGVGIATVTHDKDPQGKVTTAFHKFYYEPAYQTGGNGSMTCVKQ